jgi:hypothetical protein
VLTATTKELFQSFLRLLTVPPELFKERYTQLNAKATVTHESGWKILKRLFGKGYDTTTHNLVVALGMLLLSSNSADGRMPNVLEDEWNHALTNLVMLHSMPDGGWSISGRTILRGVLVLHVRYEKDPHQALRAVVHQVSTQRLEQLLQCCRALEWTSRDCFVGMKNALAVQHIWLGDQLRTELRNIFHWPSHIIAHMEGTAELAPTSSVIDGLEIMRNWFVVHHHGHMACYTQHLITWAKQYAGMDPNEKELKMWALTYMSDVWFMTNPSLLNSSSEELDISEELIHTLILDKYHTLPETVPRVTKEKAKDMAHFLKRVSDLEDLWISPARAQKELEMMRWKPAVAEVKSEPSEKSMDCDSSDEVSAEGGEPSSASPAATSAQLKELDHNDPM